MILTPEARSIAIASALLLSFLALAASRYAPGWDDRVLAIVVEWRHPLITTFVVGVTPLGKFQVLFPVGLAIAGALLFLDYRIAVFSAFTMTTSAAIMQGLKHVVERARPGDVLAITEPGGYSFPSGHAMATMTLALTMVCVFERLQPRWVRSGPGISVASLLVLFALAMGLSRIYLGVHYPTDVLAGWALAVAWVLSVDGCWKRTRPMVS